MSFKSKPTKLLNVREVAELLSLRPSTVYKMSHLDQIPRRYINGRTLRFHPEEIDRWVKSQPPRRKSRKGKEAAA